MSEPPLRSLDREIWAAGRWTRFFFCYSTDVYRETAKMKVDVYKRSQTLFLADFKVRLRDGQHREKKTQNQSNERISCLGTACKENLPSPTFQILDGQVHCVL